MSLEDIAIAINSFLGIVVSYVWGLPLVILLVGSGLLFSILLKGIQLKGFLHAIKIVSGKYDKKTDPGEVTHFQALSAALSGTVGLGNIAGVAVAIETGGTGCHVLDDFNWACGNGYKVC